MMDSEKIITLARTANEEIINIENITSALMPEESGENVAGNACEMFEDALDSPFHSQEEIKAKKLLGAALAIAKKNDVLPAEIPQDIDSLSIASLADESLTRAKVAYKVAAGEIDAYEGTDRLIDHATARLLAVSDKIVAQGVDMAINKLGILVARAYPQAMPIVAVIKDFQPLITQKAQTLVRNGIKKINTVAKAAVRKIGDKIKAKASNLAKLLLS